MGKARKKTRMAADEKSETKKRWSKKQGKNGRKVHFASLRDLCHLKHSELEPKFQKYKGRVVLRGDIVKDDSGSYALLTEQGSSASQMTAAKVMDIISWLPGCGGQAADAVSAYTQVKMDKWPKSWSSIEGPVVLLERNLHGHPLAGLLWEKAIWKILLKHGWEKIPNWECLSVDREKGLLLSVYVDDKKRAGQKQNIDPMWKVLMKEVDLGEPTSFPWPRLFGLHSKRMSDKQRSCRQLQEFVRIQNLWRSDRKVTMIRKTWLKYLYMVLRHGRSCKEMGGSDIANWRIKQPSNCI